MLSARFSLDEPPPFLLPCFGAFIIHLGFVLLLGNLTHPEQEFLTATEKGTSIRARLTRVVTPPPPVKRKLETPAKSSVKKKTQSNALNDLVKQLEESSVSKNPAKSPASELRIPDKKAETQESKESENKKSLDENQLRRVREYYQRNKALVERNFNTGTAAQRKSFEGLTARLKISLDAEGILTGVEIVEPSGNPVFDAEAERAVRRISFFSIPPDPVLARRYFTSLIMDFGLTQ